MLLKHVWLVCSIWMFKSCLPATLLIPAAAFCIRGHDSLVLWLESLQSYFFRQNHMFGAIYWLVQAED